MGMIVPGQKIIELLRDDPVLKKERQDLDEKDKAERAAKADSAFPPATDANPNHQADFTRLLNAAAKKREPKD
jgi:hypothetical protein